MTLGERIKDCRIESRMKQGDVCRKAKISAGFYSDVENGKRSVSAETLHALAKAFGVSMDWLFTGKRFKKF